MLWNKQCSRRPSAYLPYRGTPQFRVSHLQCISFEAYRPHTGRNFHPVSRFPAPENPFDIWPDVASPLDESVLPVTTAGQCRNSFRWKVEWIPFPTLMASPAIWKKGVRSYDKRFAAISSALVAHRRKCSGQKQLMPCAFTFRGVRGFFPPAADFFRSRRRFCFGKAEPPLTSRGERHEIPHIFVEEASVCCQRFAPDSLNRLGCYHRLRPNYSSVAEQAAPADRQNCGITSKVPCFAQQRANAKSRRSVHGSFHGRDTGKEKLRAGN